MENVQQEERTHKSISTNGYADFTSCFTCEYKKQLLIMFIHTTDVR